MKDFNTSDLKQLYIPPPDSHKGQNGKVMVIGGSELFHAASLWALDIASKIVDMVFYVSVPQNEEIVLRQKLKWHNGIVIPREHMQDYIQEADAILLGPGMVRTDTKIDKGKYSVESLEDALDITDEGVQTHFLTKYLLQHFSDKKWVIDAGAVQMMEPAWLAPLEGHVILTPHQQEFERLFHMTPTQEHIAHVAKEHNSVLLVKEQKDVVCNAKECVEVEGGNAGMTKGGTGDVLAGLTAALFAQNEDPFLVAKASSYINKKAGESLFEKVGVYFNASDLVEEIPKVMKELIFPDAPSPEKVDK